MKCFDYRNKAALVTGASSGIGAVFARELASRGANLVVVSRRQDKLLALARQLSERHGIRAEVIAADLSEPGSGLAVHQRARELGLEPEVLVNNAGFATYGHFEAISLERQLEEISLNCKAMVELTHAVLPGMLTRRDGANINVASTAALQPLPHMAIYGATKAFALSFSEALWAENRPRQIRVLAVCPGATDTAFFDVVGAREAAVGKRMSPDMVVAASLRALDRGKSHIVTGRANRLLGLLPRLLSREAAVRLVGSMLKPQAAG
jgi:short-subunit dehydrogenase